jgi:hypothetical protein
VPTEVPLIQEVQGEHVDEVGSVADGENFFSVFHCLYNFINFIDFIDLTEFCRVSGPFKGSQKIS